MMYGLWLVAGFELEGYLFEGMLSQVRLSLSKPHHTPPNEEEGVKQSHLTIWFLHKLG
jgi:hypothetical protein